MHLVQSLLNPARLSAPRRCCCRGLHKQLVSEHTEPAPAGFLWPSHILSRKRQEPCTICLPLMIFQIYSTSPLLHPRLSSLRLLLAEKPSPCVLPLHHFQLSKMAGSKSRQDLLSIPIWQHPACPHKLPRKGCSTVLSSASLLKLQKEKQQKPYYSKI